MVVKCLQGKPRADATAAADADLLPCRDPVEVSQVVGASRLAAAADLLDGAAVDDPVAAPMARVAQVNYLAGALL